MFRSVLNTVDAVLLQLWLSKPTTRSLRPLPPCDTHSITVAGHGAARATAEGGKRAAVGPVQHRAGRARAAAPR